MKIILIGADGQLGSDLFTILKQEHEVIPWYYPERDVTQLEKNRLELRRLCPDLLINTAAYNRVDDAEGDPASAFLINAVAVRDLVRLCQESDTRLMHFSSDYVFDGSGRTPYSEEDHPNPLCVYGNSKLAGEFFVRNGMERFYLIRTCGLYGVAGCWGKATNFVDTMVGLADTVEVVRVVNDQWVTPTATQELAQNLAALIQTEAYGLYHMTNSGQCTWFEFAQEIFRLIGKSPQLEPVDSTTFGSPAKRPAYSVLENRQAACLGIPEFIPWQDALRSYLLSKGHFKTTPAD